MVNGESSAVLSQMQPYGNQYSEMTEILEGLCETD